MARTPFASHHEFFRALRAADKARRRGDHRTCAHWMKLADASLKLAERMKKLALLDQESAELRERQALVLEEITDAKYARWAERRLAPPHAES